jgi:uncharacterized protein involved in exopolysaccharide biosynthesis
MEDQKNSQKVYKEEIEIDLADYIRVIWRRKKSIFAIFILVVIAAIIFSFTQPKIYQSSALVSPAKIRTYLVDPLKIQLHFVPAGEIPLQVIENLDTTINLLKHETNLKEIARKLNLSESQALSLKNQFKVSKNGELLEIKGFGSSPEKAKQIAETVTNFIFDYQKKIISPFKENLEREINFLNEQIKNEENKVAELEAKIKASEKTTSEAQGNIVAAYIQNLNETQKKLIDLRLQLVQKENELKSFIFGPKIVASAFLPSQPVGPNLKRNVAIGIVLGLFFGLFYAFAAEYWEKNKDRFK